jgi:hypothetical protein
MSQETITQIPLEHLHETRPVRQRRPLPGPLHRQRLHEGLFMKLITGEQTMKTQVEDVTPALAKEYLKRNVDNRALRRGHVETMIRAFRRGEYVMTHQGIAFDSDGNLLDGQHRLKAISEMPENFSAPMLVSRGLTREDAFRVIDSTMAKRSISDVLRVGNNITQPAHYLARLYSGTFAGITAAYVEPIVEFIRPEIEQLMDACASNTRTWSSAPVRAAAVISMKTGDSDYVKLVYTTLVRKDFDRMPRSVQTLFRAYINGTVRAVDANDIFARCLKIFDRDNSELSRIQINDISTVIEGVRKILRPVLQRDETNPSTRRTRSSASDAAGGFRPT